MCAQHHFVTLSKVEIKSKKIPQKSVYIASKPTYVLNNTRSAHEIE
jgi:hypothetical protein